MKWIYYEPTMLKSSQNPISFFTGFPFPRWSAFQWGDTWIGVPVPESCFNNASTLLLAEMLTMTKTAAMLMEDDDDEDSVDGSCSRWHIQNIITAVGFIRQTVAARCRFEVVQYLHVYRLLAELREKHFPRWWMRAAGKRWQGEGKSLKDLFCRQESRRLHSPGY